VPLNPFGHVDLLLLSVLEKGPAHGYRVIEVLRERSEGGFQLAEGTLYPALYRLERRGLVASRWASVGGRGRRVYRLTRTGRREAVAEREEWRKLVRAVEAALA
jgi:PadR family transcriptional regulator, regulatory protein PadR